MNVLHLNTLVDGGAASGAYRLHLALKSVGVNSKIIVQSKSTADEDVIAAPMSFFEKIEDKFDRRVLNIFTRATEQGKYYFLPMPFFSRRDDRILSAVPFRPDLLIVHWTTAFADVRTMDITKLLNICSQVIQEVKCQKLSIVVAPMVRSTAGWMQ